MLTSKQQTAVPEAGLCFGDRGAPCGITGKTVHSKLIAELTELVKLLGITFAYNSV